MSAPAPPLEQQLADLQARVAQLEAAQADELQPGVFSLNAAGELVETVGQLHANGIVLPLGHVKAHSRNEPGENIPSTIAWEDGAAGTKLAHVVAYNQDPKPPAVNPVRIAELISEGVNGATAVATGVQAIQSREATGFGQLLALAGEGGFVGSSALILNSLGQSDFAMFTGNLVSNRLQMQVGLTTHAFGAGFDFAEIPLHKAWEHEHLLWLASLHPAAENGCWLTNWGPYNSKSEPNLGAAFMEVNNPKAQNIDVYWLSVGR